MNLIVDVDAGVGPSKAQHPDDRQNAADTDATPQQSRKLRNVKAST
jgi:hypothetical protein